MFHEAAWRARATAGLHGPDLWHRLHALLSDPDLLRIRLQSYAACGDEDVRQVVREEFTDAYSCQARERRIERGDPHFFAEGMLLNVAAALGVAGKPETWSLSGCSESASTAGSGGATEIPAAAPFCVADLVTTHSLSRSPPMTRTRSAAIWTFAITSLALLMVALDNLVVTTALPVIRPTSAPRWPTSSGWSTPTRSPSRSCSSPAPRSATGSVAARVPHRDRHLHGGSALAALSPSTEILILARAIQGAGGAIVTPLTLTILSAAVPPERRAVALGAWGGIAGLAIAIGPLVGGAIAEGLDWHWIFWLNVPIGLVVIPLAALPPDREPRPGGRLDVAGLGLISAGLLALVWGVINGNDLGWASPQVVGALVAGAVLLVGFVAWEARQATRCCR